jgi:sodium/proline symporter
MLTDTNGNLLWLIVISFIGYFMLTTWLGKRGASYSGTLKGFAIAKGKINPWIVGISFGASYSSANLFIGVPGWAYTYGTPVLWYSLGCFGVSWIGLLLVTNKFWEYGQKNGGALTLPQWLGNRYKSRALQVIVAVLFLFNIYYIVGQNVGLATMFETVIGIPYYIGIIIGVTITIVYVGMGGAFAQIMTDGIQGTVMIAISIILFLSLFWSIGGGVGMFGNLERQLSSTNESLVQPIADSGPFYSGFAIMTIQWMLLSFVLLPHLLNKILTIEKKEDLRTFTLSSGLTLFFLSIFSVFAGLAARVLVPNLETADSAVPVYIMEVFPTAVIIIMVIGIMSAILSTTDSLYLGITTSIGNDIYKVLALTFLFKIGKKSKRQLDRNVVKISRISLVVIGIISLYMSFNRPDSLALLSQFGTSAIISGIVAPISLGYVWKKANRAGAICSVVFGSGCFMFLTSTGIHEHIFEAMFFSSIVGYLSMIIGSLVYDVIENRAYLRQMEQKARKIE